MTAMPGLSNGSIVTFGPCIGSDSVLLLLPAWNVACTHASVPGAGCSCISSFASAMDTDRTRVRPPALCVSVTSCELSDSEGTGVTQSATEAPLVAFTSQMLGVRPSLEWLLSVTGTLPCVRPEQHRLDGRVFWTVI